MHLRFKESERSGASTRLDEPDRGKRIRCPKCAWRPGRHDRWQCTCGHTWNTFETHGVCPVCAYAWRDTMCLRCHRWSPHAAWYATD
jgi:rubrerythrin